MQIEAVVLARELAHPGAGLAAERCVAARARHGQEGAAGRAHVEHAAAGGAKDLLDLVQARAERALAEGDLGDEVLVRSPPVALQDELPAQARPHVAEGARRAAHHLVLQRLVPGRAEDGLEIDRPRGIAAGGDHDLVAVPSADRAAHVLELGGRGFRVRGGKGDRHRGRR
jgi:hypothetical protein